MILAAGFLVLALAGQAVGDRIVSGPSNATTAAVGRASASYLTGIRRYTAAILWNRIDPLLHGYYENVPIEQQRYMMSTIAAVEWLDPTFDQPYYVGAWILAKNSKVAEGLAMAKAGTENIPDSGTLHMSYAQMLLLFKKDAAGAVAQGELAIEPRMKWIDNVDQINGYASIEHIFLQAGETTLAAKTAAEIDRLDALIGNSAPTDVHDHNEDGKPDH